MRCKVGVCVCLWVKEGQVRQVEKKGEVEGKEDKLGGKESR